MAIKECDKVVTLYDKQFDHGFVPKGTIGYVVFLKVINGIDCYILEISGIDDDDPLFEYDQTEVKAA